MGYVSRIVRTGGRVTSTVSPAPAVAACADVPSNAANRLSSGDAAKSALAGSNGGHISAKSGNSWMETN